jgi:hypothetical protein
MLSRASKFQVVPANNNNNEQPSWLQTTTTINQACLRRFLPMSKLTTITMLDQGTAPNNSEDQNHQEGIATRLLHKCPLFLPDKPNDLFLLVSS